MKTVHEVSKLTGLTIRTLRHYDDIGLLKVQRTGEGISNDRKLYSDEDIEKLFTIMIYKELDVPLKEIKAIMQAPGYDRSRSLEDQIEKLKAKRRHLSNIITCAEFVHAYGTELLSGSDFSPTGIDKLAKKLRSAKGYKTAREYTRSMNQTQLNDLAKNMRGSLERLASVGEIEEYDEIECRVLDFAKSLANIGGLEVSEGILTDLAFMFFSEDGAFSIVVDDIGGIDTHESVMFAFLLVCLNNWSKGILPLAHKAINSNTPESTSELWSEMQKSFGKELQGEITLQEYFDYIWVCLWTGLIFLEEKEVRDKLGLEEKLKLTEEEAMQLQNRLADHLGLHAHIDLGGI